LAFTSVTQAVRVRVRREGERRKKGGGGMGSKIAIMTSHFSSSCSRYS